MYYLTILVVRNMTRVSLSKIKVLAGLFLSGGCGESLFSCLFQLLEASCIYVVHLQLI